MSGTVVVIGAGPYGLSTAAHLRARGVKVRVFGSTMGSWEELPHGTFLASPASASSLSAPRQSFALASYCREARERRLTEDQAVPAELFVRYGRWFARQLVRHVEDIRVVSVDRQDSGFRLKLSSGEEAQAAAVVVASGPTGFAHLPESLHQAVPDGPSPRGPVSHTSQHTDLSHYSGRRVLVVGAGQSAQESAALLRESGADVRLLIRGRGLKFGAPPSSGLHWQPDSPLGRSWTSYGLAHWAAAFRRLPAATRLRLAGRAVGPRGAWWLRDRVEEQIPVLAGHTLTGAERDGTGVVVSTTTEDGGTHRLEADHVLAGTGYRVHLEALDFLSPELHAGLRRTGGYPHLERDLGSSVPGLYFTGLSAAGTFGPVMRFVCGTHVAAPRLATSVRSFVD